MILFVIAIQKSKVLLWGKLKDKIQMKENKKLVGKILKSVAKVSSESASIFCFYEPKMPMQLLKEKQTKKSCHKVNKSV